MASDYPASIDAFPDPLVNSPLNSPSHAALHQDVNDAVEKIETKVGVGVSDADDASVNQVLMADGSGGSAWESVTNSKIDTVGVPAQRVLVSDGAGSASWSGEASGLWLVNTSTFTSVSNASPFNLDNVFTTTYTHYKINIEITSVSTDLDVYIRMRTGGTPNSSNNYVFGGIITYSGSTILSGFGSNGAIGLWPIGTQNASAFPNLPMTIEMMSPQQTQRTSIFGSGFTAVNPQPYYRQMGGTMTVTTSYDGFALFPSTGTMSGIVRVYGYRN
jgi:hypothetical protein